MSIRLTRFRRIVLVITVTALVLGLWLFTDSLRGGGGSWLQGKQGSAHAVQPDTAELRLGRKRERLADSSDLAHMKERWKAMAPSMRQTGQKSYEDIQGVPSSCATTETRERTSREMQPAITSLVEFRLATADASTLTLSKKKCGHNYQNVFCGGVSAQHV